MQQSNIFDGLPQIPEFLSDTEIIWSRPLPGTARYKLEMTRYKQQFRTFSWSFLELIGVLLLLGIIWINVDWVRVTVTIVAIILALIMLYVLFQLFI